MDNDTKGFERQFIQSVKTNTQPVIPASNPKDTGQKPVLAIVCAVLSIIVLIQSIALIVVVNTNSSLFSYSEEENEESSNTLEEVSYLYNDDGNLVAMSANCKADDGSSFYFNKSNNFEEYDTTSSLIDSGDYSINRDSVFTINRKSGTKMLFYDGYNLTDGTVFYNCEEPEPDSESPEE